MNKQNKNKGNGQEFNFARIYKIFMFTFANTTEVSYEECTT